jgi:hypothetical protein
MLNHQLLIRDKVVALRVERFNSGLAESSAIVSFNFITSMNLSWLIVLQAGHRHGTCHYRPISPISAYSSETESSQL